MTGAPILQVAELSSRYGPAQVLFAVSFEMAAGEAVALLGRNGAGKSTTLKSLVGLLPTREGSIRFCGQEIGRLDAHEIARRGLGYVPEDRRIFTELTVRENLEVGRQKARGNGPSWTPERLYALFPNLGPLRDRPGGQISGGEQQMLSIARTLMGNPTLIMLDEASEGLAPNIVEQLAAAILAMKAEGIGILLAEQNLPFARLICDRAYVLKGGRIGFDGTIAELDRDETLRNAALAL